MEWLAVQPYYKIQREVGSTEQVMYEDHRTLYLYRDKIVTHYREFPIVDVFDLSFRQMGDVGGFLYLHTKLGVYSYTVKEDPSGFIEAFKSL
ncbi:hypothetical protein MNQ98_18390 [Paenibacillus sp. N3/727]|uniref:hypothetical protein n=1 Tax=Paenibacillus sp. N3/727 TaxID=2925845 RepID=UPI001F53D692|nr:hypothetical protein [Paenibacillus sp. N3/727]UNK16467.1 hypothetical protein MNQ98_18390 [Paenibacillus sp. N3/727]